MLSTKSTFLYSLRHSLALLQSSVAESHHFNADSDPTTHLFPDLDHQMLRKDPLRPPPFHFDADPDPACYFYANPDLDPDPAFQFDADPDLTPQNDPDL